MEEIFLLGIISTNKKKKKKYHVLMIILERKSMKSNLIYTNLLKIWIHFKCMNTYITTTSYVFSCTSEWELSVIVCRQGEVGCLLTGSNENLASSWNSRRKNIMLLLRKYYHKSKLIFQVVIFGVLFNGSLGFLKKQCLYKQWCLKKRLFNSAM